MFLGVYRGQVTDASGLRGNGRVRISVPAVGVMASAVAPVCYSCNCSWEVEPGNTVMVAFENGDPARPVVLGAVWGNAPPPPTDSGGSTTPQVRRPPQLHLR